MPSIRSGSRGWIPTADPEHYRKRHAQASNNNDEENDRLRIQAGKREIKSSIRAAGIEAAILEPIDERDLCHETLGGGSRDTANFSLLVSLYD